jgi:hypothetical protein
MFARLAATLAVGRRDPWRPSSLSNDREVVRRLPARPHGRPTLLCRWRLDPASGRPVCAWRTEDVDPAPAAHVRPLRRTSPNRRVVLAALAENVDSAPDE